MSGPAGDSLRTGPIARVALALTAWSERWVPDAFIFALLATALVVAAGTATASLPEVVDAWGRGFWELIPFTLQMCLVIITGHVLASSRADRPSSSVESPAGRARPGRRWRSWRSLPW